MTQCIYVLLYDYQPIIEGDFFGTLNMPIGRRSFSSYLYSNRRAVRHLSLLPYRSI